MSSKPRRPEQSRYTPPHRQQHDTAVEKSCNQETIPHAWELPQPQQKRSKDSLKSEGSSPPRAPSPRITHAWEIAGETAKRENTFRGGRNRPRGPQENSIYHRPNSKGTNPDEDDIDPTYMNEIDTFFGGGQRKSEPQRKAGSPESQESEDLNPYLAIPQSRNRRRVNNRSRSRETARSSSSTPSGMSFSPRKRNAFPEGGSPSSRVERIMNQPWQATEWSLLSTLGPEVSTEVQSLRSIPSRDQQEHVQTGEAHNPEVSSSKATGMIITSWADEDDEFDYGKVPVWTSK